MKKVYHKNVIRLFQVIQNPDNDKLYMSMKLSLKNLLKLIINLSFFQMIINFSIYARIIIIYTTIKQIWKSQLVMQYAAGGQLIEWDLDQGKFYFT